MDERANERDEYRFESFRPGFRDDKADQRTADWLQLREMGFHGAVIDEATLAVHARRFADDNRQMHAAYASDVPEAGWAGPVATADTFSKSFNTGNEVIDAFLISGVVVRPTHRRRGLLRTIMGDQLDRASRDGFAAALLLASEGGIYRRFGFGPAAYQQRIEVDTSSRFEMLDEPAGRVEITEASNLVTIAPGVYDRFHRAQPGTVGRLSRAAGIVSGTLDRAGRADPSVRAALHYDAAGTIDGLSSPGFF